MQLRAAKPIRPGAGDRHSGGPVRILEQHRTCGRCGLPGAALEFFATHGAVPLPPYIQRAAGAEDRERYQRFLPATPGRSPHPPPACTLMRNWRRRLGARGVQHLHHLHVGAGHLPAGAQSGPRAPRDARRAGGRRSTPVTPSPRRARARRARHRSGYHRGARAGSRCRPCPGRAIRGCSSARAFVFRSSSPAHQFSPAGVDAADAGVRAGRTRAGTGGLCTCGARALPVLQLRGCDVCHPGHAA